MTTEAMPRVDPVAAATYFVERLGFAAFPVWGSEAGRCFCGKPHDGSGPSGMGPDNVGKHPATRQGFKEATSELGMIRTFLSNPGTPNYGLTVPPGVLAIDVDGEDGKAKWAELQARYGELPVTFTTVTRHGHHYFYRWPERLGAMPRGKLFGYVIRRHDDGYVIGPGSVHPTGHVYDTLRQPGGMPYDIAELPEAWALAAVEAGRPADFVIQGRPLPAVGGRHDWLRDRARYYRGVIDDPAVLRATLLAENARLSQPKTEGEVDRAIGEVYAKFPADPVEAVEERVTARLDATEELDLLGAPTSGAFPAEPDDVVFEGLLGELVADLAEGTDASLVGLLGATIAYAGALIPGHAYFHRDQTSSPYIALVGESSIGRKGTAMTRVMDAWSHALETVTVHRAVLDGINSGEGLVAALHYRREHYPQEPTIGLLFEEEYATLLASRGRDGSTLDPKMRQAFDGGPLSNRKAGETKTVMPPYWLPALIGITPVELRSRLEPGALQSGSANRWLYLAVTRRDLIPTNASPAYSKENREAIQAAHRAAMRTPALLVVDPAVTTRLAEYADFLPTTAFGVAKDLTRRLSIVAFRVALVHALVERSVTVTPGHLERAIGLTEYARRGISWVFGDTIGNPDADLLFRHLQAAGRLRQNTITRQIIRDPIRRQVAIDELLRLGRAQVVTIQTSGRARSELVPTPGGGAFVHFVQGFDNSAGHMPENVDEMDESAQTVGRKVDESRTKGGRKRTKGPSSQDVDESWTKGGLSSTGSSTGKWVTPCHFYQDHTSAHRLTEAGWVCDICGGTEAAA